MSLMAVLTHGSSSSRPPISTPQCFNRRHLKHLNSFSIRHRLFSDDTTHILVPHFFKPSISRMRSLRREDAENYEAASSSDTPEGRDRVADEVFGDLKNKTTGTGSSFLAKLAIALGIAAIGTIISVGLKRPVLGSSLGVQCLADGSASSVSAAPVVGFTFKAFGYRVVLPEYAPGWIYFWLLMAAGCGLFISEEALNIWVGISLARLLSLDGTWQSFAESFSRNAPYIISTIAWVYWGVCISDMIPFYLGKLFRQTKASDDVCSKLGIGKEKALSITQVVQRYGNLIGFGHISRVFLCWCLFWWLDHSSTSVGDRFPAEGASCVCPCYCCISSGNLDCVSLCCGCFNSIIPFLAMSLHLVLLKICCLYLDPSRLKRV